MVVLGKVRKSGGMGIIRCEKGLHFYDNVNMTNARIANSGNSRYRRIQISCRSRKRLQYRQKSFQNWKNIFADRKKKR